MVQWLRFHTPNASPIPGMGTMILRAAQHGQRKKECAVGAQPNFIPDGCVIPGALTHLSALHSFTR